MFAELKKLLMKRPLTITVAMLDSDEIRLNVVPHATAEDKKVNQQISYSHKSEVAAIPEAAVEALTTPLSITGAAEEIDERLPAILAEYIESHVQLQASFDRASGEIAEAVKAINERNKAKVKEKAVKKEEKSKSEDANTKPGETLPLWWTDRSVAAPGASQTRAAAPIQAVSPSTGQDISKMSEVTE